MTASTLPRRLSPRRYQLSKGALAAVRRGHPWIYRKHMSSAADVMADGQWLALVDGNNRAVGLGLYSAKGAVAVRVAAGAEGARRPSAGWVRERVLSALQARSALREETDGFRAIHGDSDGLPGVTIDVYGPVAVVQCYLTGAEAVARLAGAVLCGELGLTGLAWRPPTRRRGQGDERPLRVLRGAVPELVRIREGEQSMTVPSRGGQKSGMFLDLRNLRRWLRAQDLTGARVLNLFSYTGTLGQAAALGGAAQVTHVDASEAALELARQFHGGPGHEFVRADLFEGVPGTDVPYDLVIVDPPNVASTMKQVPGALRSYERLYRQALRQLRPGGTLVACCCSSRIEAGLVEGALVRCIPRDYRTQRLPIEVDHPASFSEADYLKVWIASPGSPSSE